MVKIDGRHQFNLGKYFNQGTKTLMDLSKQETGPCNKCGYKTVFVKGIDGKYYDGALTLIESRRKESVLPAPCPVTPEWKESAGL